MAPAIGAIFAPPPPSEQQLAPSIIPTAASASHVAGGGMLITNTQRPAEVAQLIARRSPFAATDGGGGGGEGSTPSYATSMDNISRLLDGFMKSSLPPQNDAAADNKPSPAVAINPFLCFDHMSAAGALLPAISSDMPPLTPPPPQQQQQALAGLNGSCHEPKQQQLSSIENWLFDEDDDADLMDMDLSDGCCSVPMMF